jgi:hypothetical protein
MTLSSIDQQIMELERELSTIADNSSLPHQSHLIRFINHKLSELYYQQYNDQYAFNYLVNKLMQFSIPKLHSFYQSMLDTNLFIPPELSYVLDYKNRLQSQKMLEELILDELKNKK